MEVSTCCSLIIGGARLMHSPLAKYWGLPQDRRPWATVFTDQNTQPTVSKYGTEKSKGRDRVHK